MEEIKSREQVISFMQEMTARFEKDHVPDLMKHRCVKECEELAEESYAPDQRFEAVATYAITQGGINATIEDFKTEELMNILMFFYCFESEYEGCDAFNETYILSPEEYKKLIVSLYKSEYDVAIETAGLLGISDDEDAEIYEYDSDNWHITEITMGVLIACEDPGDKEY